MDDVETADSAWIAEGFLRHANILPQEWLLQAVTFGQDGITVTPLLRWNGNTGSWTLPMSRQDDRVVLVISALAPVTTELAPYQITLAAGE